MNKVFIRAGDLLNDSIKLALDILDDGFKPTHIVGVWRGGSPIAIAIHEVMGLAGLETEHLAIKANSYTSIGKRDSIVKVTGLELLLNTLSGDDKVLLVDDVHDTGLSLDKIIGEILRLCESKPEIRSATPYFKPENNKTNRNPDYFIHTTNDWLVFPHELEGLSYEEISNHKPDIASQAERLIKIKK